MHKYAALISYVGTRFCGWQKQTGPESGTAHSIQETIELAIAQMTGETLAVVGSGRTDAGVHAAGQVAHFVLKKKEWDPRILKRGLNSILPRVIRVLEVRAVPIEFHAQRTAERKQYSYYFQQGPEALPHLEPTSWWIQKPLDLEAMREAASRIVGEHDFKPFQSSGAKPGSTVRTIFEAEIRREPIVYPGSGIWGESGASLVRFRVVGSGFLKQMVRGLAGTLLQVGEGRRPAACFEEILRTLDRSLVGPTAPARALWLEQVWYGKALTFFKDPD
jgi:tRNA pseudouridine38-40 synthase